MSSLTSSKPPLLLALLAFSFLASAHAGGSTLLRRSLQPGTDRYAVKSVVTTIPSLGMPGGPRSSVVTWSAAYTLSAPTGNQATLDLKVDDFEMNMPGVTRPAGIPAPPRTRSVQATLDAQNRTRVTSEGKNGTGLGWLPIDLIEFPASPVSVGTVWNVTLPSSILLGDHPGVVKAKVTADKKDAWEVTLKGANIPVQQTARLSMGGQSQEAKIKGSAEFTVRALIEKRTGRTLELTFSGKKQQEMSVPGVEMTTPTQVEFAGSMRRKA